MVKLIQQGTYSLIETNGMVKVLNLDDDRMFVWINAEKIGEILITSHSPHRAHQLLARGRYRLYDVKNEPKLTDIKHFELLVGDGKWQGYLLPTGLPTDDDKKNRIIPTQEIITKSIN